MNYLNFDFFSFWRQAIAYTVFFSIAMLAFCIRHHGDKLPECGSNSTVAETNSTVMYGQDTLTAFTLAAFDTGTVKLSANDSLDSLSGGFTDYPGNDYVKVWVTDLGYKNHFLNLLTSKDSFLQLSIIRCHFGRRQSNE